MGGLPHPTSDGGGGTPSQVWMVGVYPISGLDGGGYPIPGLDGGGWVPEVPPTMTG